MSSRRMKALPSSTDYGGAGKGSLASTEGFTACTPAAAEGSVQT